MSKSNAVFLVGLVFIILVFSILFAFGKDAVQINRSADSAIFEQVVENIYANVGAVSNVFSSTQNYIDKLYFAMPPEERVAQELSPPSSIERSVLGFHAYWILFFFAPFLKFLDSSLLLTIIHLTSYALLISSAMLVTLRSNAGTPGAIIIAFIVAMTPMVLGAIFGQFYPDRIFVFLGFAICALVYFRAGLWLIFFCAILVALVNERAALIGGVVMIVIPFCRRDEPLVLRENFHILAIGFSLVVYSVAVEKIWLSNLYYDNYLPTGIMDLVSRFGDETFFHNSFNFILANSALLVLALGNYRLMLLVWLIMSPNLIGSVGGAEKVGWLTHYHSYYFPILVFSAAIGLGIILNSKGFKRKLIVVIVSISLSVFSFQREFSFGRLPTINDYSAVYDSLYNRLHNLPTGYNIRKEVVSLVPKDAFVVSDELGMALFVNHATLDLFPVSINKADYLFIPCNWDMGNKAGRGEYSVANEWITDHGFQSKPKVEVAAIGRCLYVK